MGSTVVYCMLSLTIGVLQNGGLSVRLQFVSNCSQELLAFGNVSLGLDPFR